MTAEPVSPYERWAAAYREASGDPSRLGDHRCPNCGERALRLVYLVDDPSDRRGRGVFWCDNCRHGRMPAPDDVPPGAARVIDDAAVPDYTIVSG